MQKLWLSLYAALLFAAILVITGNQIIRSDALERAESELQTEHRALLFNIQDFKNTQMPLLQMLSTHRLVKTYSEDAKDMHGAIEALFYDMVDANRNIMQLRLLDLQGNEQVRVDRLRNGQIAISPKKMLQNKAHRNYFQEFMKLQPGETLFSHFDLNIENKKVEIPFNPTLRAGVPAMDGDRKVGLIVINYYMQEWIYNFSHFSSGDIYLVDEDDFFLLHPDPAWAWSRYLTPSRTASSFFGKSVHTIALPSSKSLRWIDDTHAVMPLDFFGNPLRIVYQLPYAPAEVAKEHNLIFGGIVTLAFTLILTPLFLIIRFYVREIKQKRSEAVAAENYLQSLFDNTFDAIIIIDHKGIIQRVNGSTCKVFDYQKTELLGKNIKILVPQPHHDLHDDYIRSHDPLLKSKIIGHERELFGLHRTGRLIPISLAITKVDINTKTYFIGSIRDISEQTRSKQIFEKLFSSTPLGIALLLPNGNFWRYNSALCHLLGYTDEEMRRLHLAQLDLPNTAEPITLALQAIETKELPSFTTEKCILNRSGDSIWVTASLSPIYLDEEQQRLEYIVMMLDDITERKMMIEELESTKEGLSEAEQMAQLGHWDLDMRRNVLVWSSSMMELFGEKPETFGGTLQSFIQYVHPEDRDHVTETIQYAIQNHDGIDLHYRIITPDGTEKIIYARGSVTYDDGTPARMFGICQDVTEIKHLEEKEKMQERMLLQQSKQAAMGELLGAIAHQWRQPLNSIGLIIQDMDSAYRHNDLDEAYFKESRDEMMHQLHYMSNTIDEFRNFFTKSAKREHCNLVTSVNEVNHLFWAQAKAHGILINIVCESASGALLPCQEHDYTSEIYTVDNYPSEIKQLLLNLVSNAKEAIELLENPLPRQQQIDIIIRSGPESVTIEICDLAEGIPEAIRLRIFEPYFTTKEMGTGLGLYIAKTLADTRLKASLEYDLYDVTEGETTLHGSRFTLKLPRHMAG